MELPQHSNPRIEAVLRQNFREDGVVHLTVEAQWEINRIMAEEFGEGWDGSEVKTVEADDDGAR